MQTGNTGVSSLLSFQISDRITSCCVTSHHLLKKTPSRFFLKTDLVHFHLFPFHGSGAQAHGLMRTRGVLPCVLMQLYFLLSFNIENPKHEAFRNICEHLATHHSPGKFALFRRGSEDDIHFGYEAKDEEKSDDRYALSNSSLTY